MRPLTMVLPHYRNLGMLAEHQRIWMDYPEELKRALHVIVVDDGSPKGSRPSAKSMTVRTLASVRLYRCLKDVRWNWLFCRNLGVDQAETEWVLLTDIDHALPASTLERLCAGELDSRDVYRLSRVDAPHPWPYRLEECPVRTNKMVHPNTWLMTRDMFDRVGGYDERLSGCYGTDAEFRDRVQQHARAVTILPEVMVRYPREIVADASTVGLTRKNDPSNDDDLRNRRLARAQLHEWRPLRLTFKWERLL